MKKIFIILFFILTSKTFSQEKKIDLPFQLIYETLKGQKEKSKIKLNVEKQYSEDGNKIIIEEYEHSITYYNFDNRDFCENIQIYTSLSQSMAYIAFLNKKYLSAGENKWSFTRNGMRYYIVFGYEEFGGSNRPVFKVQKRI